MITRNIEMPPSAAVSPTTAVKFLDGKSSDNGGYNRRVVRRKRPIRAAGDQKLRHASVIGPDPVDEQQDDLIGGEAQQNGQTGADGGVADMEAIRAAGTP